MTANATRLAAVALAAGLLMQAGGGLAQAASPEDPAAKLRDPSRVVVIAHRGCVGEAPEVSVSSIHACAGKGIDGIELDIRKSSDGVLVAIHDATLDRTTNGSGRVADHTAAELRELRLRRGNGGRSVVVTDEHLPTVEEMLLAAREHGFIVHLDIKDATHAEVADLVERLGMEGQGIAWVTGSPEDSHQPDPGDVRALAIMARIQDCPEGAPATCRPNDMRDLMGFARYDPAGYFLWYRSTPEFFAAFNAAERPPGTRLSTETLWEIDNLPPAQRHAEYRRLLDAGATMFLTDKPRDLVSFLQREKEESR
ncbi:glycerophosphodiester phosphodiesterase family protein [Novilysobacter defluvii]|uniref:Glycerophosphodiester phosphodiesterase n=1 Tax=Lysobacter defluvii IMMIB APB-9 = DSM 18482 TaxID=1385515 RepID=A0A0A0MBC5_9GAMM|nr:glycerophosphodiester phosphodiesterase family protein [Lysobacter defluvii]KGO99894.1 glycerophosphodiester phosphodiesterase [Lysobacter defluvii IMMIB APB-9 = DSM 18482]